MDPLSDVLSLLKPRSYRSGGLAVGGDLALHFHRHSGVHHSGIKCYAVMAGSGWLVVEGFAPMRLSPGDCFLLLRGLAFTLTTDLDLAPQDALALIAAGRLSGVAPDSPGAMYLAGGHFLLGDGDAGLLLGALPPVIHLRSQADKAALRWALDRLREELGDPQPGGALVAQHLGHMMLVQALRLHLAEGGGVGWLSALADPQMRAAIGAMHEAPAQRWTLQALAAHAGMSRSSFAQRFKQSVGVSPMDYLTRWRMLLAADRLTQAGEPLSAIALSLGYESESAFSTAFKRVMGSAPRRYGRGSSGAGHQNRGVIPEDRATGYLGPPFTVAAE